MGNKNSICPSEKYLETIECPICLEDTSRYITLNCGHKFDYYCIQMHIFIKELKENEINCPYCRTTINNKILNEIWDKWIIVNFKYELFSNYTLYNINNKYLKISKLNQINFNSLNFNSLNLNSFNSELENYNILIPLFSNKPAYLLSPTINDSNVLYDDKVISLSQMFENYITNFNEKIDSYNFILDCYIRDDK